MNTSWYYNVVSIKKQFLIFCLRWLANSLGLWIAARVLAQNGVDYSGEGLALLLGGLILSVMNTILRPIIIILSLPAILLTLGLFMIIVNGVVVYFAAMLTPGLQVTFSGAILTGLIIAVINYALSGVIELRKEAKSI